MIKNAIVPIRDRTNLYSSIQIEKYVSNGRLTLEEASSNTPSLSNIHLFGLIAQLTYQDASAIKEDFSKIGFVANTLTSDSLQTVVSYDAEDSYIIAFRGTSNPTNWARDDARIKLIDVQIQNQYVSVHRGFWYALDSQWSAEGGIYSSLKSNSEFKNAQYHISGHSLGGGMAFLCALKLLDLGIPEENIQLYTYGQPRTFGDSIQSVIGKKIYSFFTGTSVKSSSETLQELMKNVEYYRIVNEDDIVPRIPPEITTCIPCGYKHFGKLVYLDHGTVTYPEFQEDDIVLQEWQDHLMTPYLDNISATLSGDTKIASTLGENESELWSDI